MVERLRAVTGGANLRPDLRSAWRKSGAGGTIQCVVEDCACSAFLRQWPSGNCSKHMGVWARWQGRAACQAGWLRSSRACLPGIGLPHSPLAFHYRLVPTTGTEN